MSFYESRPTGIADNIIEQTIIPFLSYSIPKGVLENAGTENAGTGKCFSCMFQVSMSFRQCCLQNKVKGQNCNLAAFQVNVSHFSKS